MKIALALEYPLMQQGGTEVLVRELARKLAAHYEIVLVSGEKTAAELPDDLARVICRHFPWEHAQGDKERSARLAFDLRSEGVRLAHFHFGGTYEWSSNRFWRCPVYYVAKAGIPCLSTNHLASEWLKCGVNPARPIWQQHLYQLFAILSRSVIYGRLKLEVCVSKHDQARVRRSFPHFSGRIAQLYHSLLDANAEAPDLTNREPVVLCVGMIAGRKAQPVLGEAFARVAGRFPKWRLRFIGRVGDPGYVDQIRASASRHGVEQQVEIAGRLDDAEVLREMKTASIIAMPSLQEGLGLSLQEALFHGCAGVGSRAGGISELIEHEVNGLLCPPGDVSALAGALERLFSNEELLRQYQRAARPSIVRKQMTSAAMVENYLRIYRQLA